MKLQSILVTAASAATLVGSETLPRVSGGRASAIGSGLAPRGQGPSRRSLPTSFQWSSSNELIVPKNDSRQLTAVKDPSIVFHDGTWHVFATTVKSGNWGLFYLNFTDWKKANDAKFYYLDQSPIGPGYRAAPEAFYFAPQNLWYLVYQNGNAAYSTNPDISNPAGWTAPKTFYPTVPKIIEENIGNGYWVDMWVICDSANCHLFSSDDNGHLYRSQTPLSDFPKGFSQPIIALEDQNRYRLFEASNVYRYDNSYLLIVEAIGSNGRRYFRSWTSSAIAGPWKALADTEENPFARANNVVFQGTPWSKDISHGELIRNGTDQNLTIDPCNLRYLYQGLSDPNFNGSYADSPYRIGLLTQTNSAC